MLIGSNYGHRQLSKIKQQILLRHIVYGGVIFLVLLISSIQLLNLSPYKKSSGLEYVRAKVVSVQNRASLNNGSNQLIKGRILDGEDKGHQVLVSRTLNFGDASYKRLPIGSEILLSKDVSNGNHYAYSERWHIPGVASLFLIFLVLVILIGWWRGITSVFGLVISIAVLTSFVLPQVLSGHDAYTTCIQAAFIITAISVFVAHGLSKRTTIAFMSSIFTLGITIALVALATYLTGTSEVISEETTGVLYSSHPISLSGLLTGGIIIASLGVLYDITTAQAAAVDEIYKANIKLPTISLYRKALSIGREHIAALVNTLALVYAGVALPSIIITSLYNHAPLSVILNNESVVEEVVRTSVASISMLLAVPITTALAAYTLPRWYKRYGL